MKKRYRLKKEVKEDIKDMIFDFIGLISIIGIIYVLIMLNLILF